MAHLKVEPDGRAVTVLAKIEEYCERMQIEAPRVNVSLTASAILDEVGTIRRVLARIAEDKSLRPDAKCEFTDCLGALSRKMKHILRTQVQPTSLRAARTKQEGYLPELHGVRF